MLRYNANRVDKYRQPPTKEEEHEEKLERGHRQPRVQKTTRKKEKRDCVRS